MSTPKCPVCEKNPPEAAYKPFCSKRCADVDLSRWLKGAYAIPGRPADSAEETPSRREDSEG